ncbi:MAG: phosphonate ABC transporter ATP-binding protein [Lautropia sp.]
MTHAVSIRGISKSFGATRALDGVDLDVRSGEMVALLGASGSGKSTLLRQVCGLAAADGRGSVEVFGRSIQRDGRLAKDLREQRSRIAVIFQQFNLVDRLPVMLNVLVGSLHRQPWWRALLRQFPAHERARAYEALDKVGIAHAAWQRASTLSGGQQQRAAISRAMVQCARLVLADEPIASLDPESSRRVMALLQQLNHEQGMTVMVSLHQIDFAFAYCPRTVALHQGRVVYDGPTRALTPERLRDLYGAASAELFDPGERRAFLKTDAVDPEPVPVTAPATPSRDAAWQSRGLRVA